MSVTRIALISGSHRPQGASTRLATELQQLAHEHIEGCETEMVPIDDLPFWDESLWGDPAAAPHWDGWRATAQRLRNVDGLIVVDLPPEEDKLIPTVCASLEEALAALDADREFLTRGGVFSNDFIDAYIELKMDEVNKTRMTAHPVEFQMYYSL